MQRWFTTLAFGSLLCASTSHAGLLSGFEQGLVGWEHIGDVSVQSSDIGLSPTQAQHMVFVSTMCDGNSPPVQGGGCEITTNEHPYSGISSPSSAFARAFLGLPDLNDLPLGFDDVMPYPSESVRGESGAIKMRFFAPQAGVVSFDWNKIGWDPDSAYVSLWSDDPSKPFRINDWIFEYSTFSGTFGPSGVDLCSRYYDDPAPPSCPAPSLNVETGWATKPLVVPESGWYWIGFALGEVAEGTVPSVLALDNVRYQVVPEPASVALLGLGLAGLAIARRRKTS